MTSNLRWCAPCHTHHWKSETCWPSWYAWIDGTHMIGDKSDSLQVRASNAEAAAQRACQDSDDGGDGPDLGTRVVFVASESSPSHIERHEVHAEVTVQYTVEATEMPGGMSIHAAQADPEVVVFWWVWEGGEESGYLQGDSFVRQVFASWDEAVGDARRFLDEVEKEDAR